MVFTPKALNNKAQGKRSAALGTEHNETFAPCRGAAKH